MDCNDVMIIVAPKVGWTHNNRHYDIRTHSRQAPVRINFNSLMFEIPILLEDLASALVFDKQVFYLKLLL